MRVLTEPLRELAEFESIQKNLQQGRGTCVSLSGCVDSQKLHMVYGLGESFRCKLIVTHNERRVREIAEEFSFYDRNVMVYPAKDLILLNEIGRASCRVTPTTGGKTGYSGHYV